MLALEPTTTAAEAVTRLLDRLLPALPAGARVVTDGAYLLKSKLMRLRSGGGDE